MLREERIILSMMVIALLLGAFGCGKTSSNEVATTPVTGSVFAAPVSGGSVVVKDANGNTIGGPVTTANDGTFTVNVPTAALSSDMRVESTGGTYDDEATGTNTTAGTLAAFVSSESLTKGTVHLDPSSTIVHHLVTRGSKTFGEAQSIFNTAFGFQPDCSIALKNSPSTGGTEAERMKAFRAGVFSQMTKDMGLTPDKQSDLLAEMAQDLADDGKLNGSAGAGIPEDIQNKFENAMASYLTDTIHNKTGLDTGKIGNLPMGKIALTPTYRVEYIPAGTMGSKVGKSAFTLKITDRLSLQPVSGLTIELMPLMHMPDKNHATPVAGIVDNNDGTYTCTVYYLMASGPAMGFWEMKAMISAAGSAAEPAVFHPAVGMAMGDTARANLNGVSELVSSMTGGTPSKRTYQIFKDGLISGPTSTFNLFISTMEDMMHFPAVSAGTVLSGPTGTWTVDPVTTSLQASLDNTFASGTVFGIDNGKGHWSLPGISGLATGVTSTIYVKFIVNGELKTAGTSTAAPGYATFLVTPAATSGI